MALFCHFRTRDPLTLSTEKIGLKLKAERDEAMARLFEPAELREEIPGQGPSDLKRKIQASEDALTKMAEKYREQ